MTFSFSSRVYSERSEESPVAQKGSELSPRFCAPVFSERGASSAHLRAASSSSDCAECRIDSLIVRKKLDQIFVDQTHAFAIDDTEPVGVRAPLAEIYFAV
jgi:hypothetical protein